MAFRSGFRPSFGVTFCTYSSFFARGRCGKMKLLKLHFATSCSNSALHYCLVSFVLASEVSSSIEKYVTIAFSSILFRNRGSKESSFLAES